MMMSGNDMAPGKKLWIDTRLTAEEMDFLWGCISEENKVKGTHDIFRSEMLIDKDNWFFETTLKPLTEKMFYDDWNNYREYIVGDECKPKFELTSIWVNYMKQHEFRPLHDHGGLYSFVVFVKIPIHWKEQHALSITRNPKIYDDHAVTTLSVASNFQFVWSTENKERCQVANFPLSPEDEGRMLFFTAKLHHLVYPFYECEEKRITISGNIVLCDPNRPKNQEITVDEYEKKKETIKIVENSVIQMKEELKQMKKTSEKEK